jgi:hypothetical protein
MSVYCMGINQTLYDKDLDKVMEKMWLEFDTNSKEVAKTFGKFVYEYIWPHEKTHTDVSGDLAAMLRVRFKINGSRRAPKVVLLGPPGSGRST